MLKSGARIRDRRSVERGQNVPTAWRRALHENAPFLTVVTLYVLAGLAIFHRMGRSIPYTVAEIYEEPVLLTGLYLGITLLLVIGRDVFLAGRRPFDSDTWSRVWRSWLGQRRLLGTLLILVALPSLMNVMLGFRQSLTFIQPFRWDPLFMQWDAWLHGGRHPWELLQPVVGKPPVTALLDDIYVYGWFGILWLGVIWQAVHGREPRRSQFLLSFAVAWILFGTVMAIALSSAGPAYFERVTGLADPYAPLMSYLHSVDATTPLHALENQALLWDTYTHYGGITAMPSMHLTIVTTVVIVAILEHRLLALIVLPMLIAILIGSIHLGWHYAIDSYAGIAGAAAIWWVSGRFTRWWQNRWPGHGGT